MKTFFPIEETHNKLKLEDFNNNNSTKYSSMKNIIIRNSDYKDRNNKPALYKNSFINNNTSFINQNNDIRRLLHLSLMEFIKKNYKYKNDSIICLKNIKNNNYFNNPNIKFLFPERKKKLTKKLIANYFTNNNNFSNKTYRNIEHEFSSRKNSVFAYQYKNSSFINDLYNNKNNKTEKKKISLKNRVNSSVERNRVNNIKLFGKNNFEEKNLEIDYEFPTNKIEFPDNNIVYIRKKNKYININDYNKNIPFLNKEPLLKGKLQKNIEKFEEEKIINQKNGKTPILKKNQSLPDINTERKENNHNKIRSSYIPNDVNRKINSLRNDNYLKDSINYFNEKKKKTKKVFEYIYDNNFNAEFHFLSIKFGLSNQKKNKYQMYNNYTDNINTMEKEEIIVKAYKKDLFLNKELTNRNSIKNLKNYSNKNNCGYNKTSVSRKSTEENKNNLSNKKKNKDYLNEKIKNSNGGNNINKKNEMKNFYKSKFNKFDIQKSILFFNKKDKKDNEKNEQMDMKKNLLNKQEKKRKEGKDKFYNTENGFHDFKNNKMIDKTPVIINRYITKRKKNNNDDIIGLI